MIGFLKGTIALRDDPYIFLDVSGVGYKILVARDVLVQAQQDELLLVYTYTFVREDALELFGFSHYEDLKLFEKLIGVSGIGPKTAIQVFSTGTGTEILNAIISGNVDFFTAVPRLGKKNAQKIIIELRNKFTADEISITDFISTDHQEVIEALQTFGYSTKEITTALKNIPLEDMATPQKIKAVLKYFGKG